MTQLEKLINTLNQLKIKYTVEEKYEDTDIVESERVDEGFYENGTSAGFFTTYKYKKSKYIEIELEDNNGNYSVFLFDGETGKRFEQDWWYGKYKDRKYIE